MNVSALRKPLFPEPHRRLLRKPRCQATGAAAETRGEGPKPLPCGRHSPEASQPSVIIIIWGRRQESCLSWDSIPYVGTQVQARGPFSSVGQHGCGRGPAWIPESPKTPASLAEASRRPGNHGNSDQCRGFPRGQHGAGPGGREARVPACRPNAKRLLISQRGSLKLLPSPPSASFV